MGRTFEALTHGHARRMVTEEEGTLPPTQVVPGFASSAMADLRFDVDQASKDTALEDDIPGDNDSVPYIEVGERSATGSVLITPLTPTPIPNSISLVLPETVPAVSGRETVSFYPLSEPKSVSKDQPGFAKELVTYYQPGDALSAQYRQMSAGISNQIGSIHSPIVLFSAASNHERAAKALLNLAIIKAKENNEKVLIVEANYENPGISQKLGIASLPGLRELLNRSLPMSVALHQTAQKNLWALPPGDPEVPVSQEAEQRLPDLMKRLRARFDCLLVNGPRWGTGYAADWLGMADSVYLVIESLNWDDPELESSHNAIIASGAKLRGYVSFDSAA